MNRYWQTRLQETVGKTVTGFSESAARCEIPIIHHKSVHRLFSGHFVGSLFPGAHGLEPQTEESYTHTGA